MLEIVSKVRNDLNSIIFCSDLIPKYLIKGIVMRLLKYLLGILNVSVYFEIFIIVIFIYYSFVYYRPNM